MKWFVYILICEDNSFYVGHTNNVEKRFERHLVGRGAHYTAKHAPTSIAYKEEFLTETDAVARERQIKKWSRAKKQALIDNDMARLRMLSRSREH